MRSEAQMERKAAKGDSSTELSSHDGLARPYTPSRRASFFERMLDSENWMLCMGLLIGIGIGVAFVT